MRPQQLLQGCKNKRGQHDANFGKNDIALTCDSLWKFSVQNSPGNFNCEQTFDAPGTCLNVQ